MRSGPRRKRIVPMILLSSVLGSCESGGSDPSAPGRLSQAVAPPGSPNAPMSLRATLASPTSFTLDWLDMSSDEIDFILQRATVVGTVYSAYGLVTRPPADSITYTDTGLTPGITYRYRIRACNSFGCSSFANSPKVTPP